MSYAIDTNVILRYLRNDDPAQNEASRKLIDDIATRDEPIHIGAEVLTELYWYLAKRLKKTRGEIVDLVHRLLDNPHLAIVDQTAVEAALDAYQQGPAGFIDYLIGARAISAGAEFTYTFDMYAARHPIFRLLPQGT